MHHLQASKAEDTDAEGLRVKLRAAVKKGKAIEKQRADLEAQLTSLREQVVINLFIFSVCELICCGLMYYSTLVLLT